MKIDFGKETIKNRYSSDLQTYLRSVIIKCRSIFTIPGITSISRIADLRQPIVIVSTLLKIAKRLPGREKEMMPDGMFMIGGADKMTFFMVSITITGTGMKSY